MPGLSKLLQASSGVTKSELPFLRLIFFACLTDRWEPEAIFLLTFRCPPAHRGVGTATGDSSRHPAPASSSKASTPASPWHPRSMPSRELHSRGGLDRHQNHMSMCHMATLQRPHQEHGYPVPSTWVWTLHDARHWLHAALWLCFTCVLACMKDFKDKKSRATGRLKR